MKKFTAVLLAMVLTLGLTACGGGKTEEVAKDETEGKSAEDILNDVWDAFGEDESFAVNGGDYDNMVENAAGTADASNGEVLDQLFGFPAANVDRINDAASLVHMMNQNTFTASAYHVTDAAELEDLAADMKDNILNRQWMCGFPDELVIYSVGSSYLVAAFGSEMNVENFETHLTETFESAVLLHDESLL